MKIYRRTLNKALIFTLLILAFLFGSLFNSYLVYKFDTLPKYGKVMSYFSEFASSTAVSKGYWPEDVEEYKKYLLANDGERIFAYVVYYELKIELITKTNTYAEYKLTFSRRDHFNKVVKK